MPNFHTLKRYSHRTAPKKLIPAIIACKCVPYLVVFGLIVCVCGFIPSFLLNQSITASDLDQQNINTTSTAITVQSNQTVSENVESIDNQDFDYFLYACLAAGSLLIIAGIICIFIAYYYFKIYQEERIRHIQVTDLDNDQTNTVITDPIINGVRSYPINLLSKSKQSQYFPISQTSNDVYKSTTEQIK